MVGWHHRFSEHEFEEALEDGDGQEGLACCRSEERRVGKECWSRLLRVPWTARRSNQSILKEISLEYSSEGLMF